MLINSIFLFMLIICIFHQQLLNIGSNYNYGPEEHTEYLCVVSRDVHDSTSQTAPEKQPSKVSCQACFEILFFKIIFRTSEALNQMFIENLKGENLHNYHSGHRKQTFKNYKEKSCTKNQACFICIFQFLN